MSINKFNSCERNNYFFGKLMTVKDFENEQNYFNSKRQLCTRLLHGFGIVSGLKVFLVNNQTISIDAGVAVDQKGREIVVPEDCVKKISVIEGFEECCDSKELYLGLRYREDLEETTFSVASSGKSSDVSQEYNRIHEGYQLFFTKDAPKPDDVNLDYLITEEKVIFNKKGVLIKAILPKYVNPSSFMKVTIIFEKSDLSSPVNFKFDLEGEFFKGREKEGNAKIEYKETEISTYKVYKQDYYVYCDAVSDALADIKVSKKSFSLDIGGKKQSLEGDVNSQISVTTKSLRDVLINQYYSLNLDKHFSSRDDDGVYLAKFHLVSNQSDYFIEAFENNPFNQYLLNTQMLTMFDKLDADMAALCPSEIQVAQVTMPQQTITTVEQENFEKPAQVSNDYVTGVEDVTLGFYPKVGKCYVSNEFVHGLGYGQIAVTVALENPENLSTGESHLYYFGNRSVFDDEELSISSPKVDIAAIVNPEKGTMKIGIKLLEKTEQTSVKVRWWACKPTNSTLDEDAEVVLDESVKVVITPPTAQIEPLGQYRFTAKIEGAGSQEVKWFVVEDGTGTIDDNGLYTAPSKEGVYEIRAQSVKYERKYASAYVVVSTY